MIVLDASVVVEVLRGSAVGRRALDRWRDHGDAHAPHLVQVEALHVIRRWVAEGSVRPQRGGALVAMLPELAIDLHPHELLLPRAWALRANLSAYDATYVALAELLEAPLLTLDGRLAGAPGNRATIELLAA